MNQVAAFDPATDRVALSPSVEPAAKVDVDKQPEHEPGNPTENAPQETTVPAAEPARDAHDNTPAAGGMSGESSGQSLPSGSTRAMDVGQMAAGNDESEKKEQAPAETGSVEGESALVGGEVEDGEVKGESALADGDGEGGEVKGESALADGDGEGGEVKGERALADGEGEGGEGLAAQEAVDQSSFSGPDGRAAAPPAGGGESSRGEGETENQRDDGVGGGLESEEGVEWIEYSTLSNVRLIRGPSVRELEKRKDAMVRWNSLEPAGHGKSDVVSATSGAETAATPLAVETPAGNGNSKREALGGKANPSPKSRGGKWKGKGKRKSKPRGTFAVGKLARIMAEASGKAATGGVSGTGSAPSSTGVV